MRIPLLVLLLLLPRFASASWPSDPTTNVPLSIAPGAQQAPQASAQDLGGLVGDGNGGALVTWPQTDFGTSHIFVHHVLSTGALDPAWPGAGRRLYNDFYHQDSPAIVTDGAGGVLVTYLDYHFQPGTREVRAHRVLGSGTVDPAWPDTGLVLCRSTGEKLFPAIVESDTAAIAVWLDQRDGHWDLYAQRFFRTGIVDPDWPIDGRAIATADLDQVNPTLVPDGVGGVILAWEDRRGDNNDGDIYAQSIKGNGQLGDPPVGVPGDAGFDFELRFPNPIRAGAMMVRFTLPGSEGASPEVFDVVGRRVTRLDVGSLGGGPHAVDLAAGWKPVPGVYFVRLSQGPHTNVRRIVLLD